MYHPTENHIIEKMRNSPRLLYGLLLVICLTGVVSLSLLGYPLGSLPLPIVPAEYWLYSGLGLVFFLGFVISLDALLSPKRSLAVSMMSLGTINILSFLCRITSTGLTGNMAMHMILAGLCFAIALAAKYREKKSTAGLKLHS